jgi:uncharacterized protein YjbJ (UPF0337 family)
VRLTRLRTRLKAAGKLKESAGKIAADKSLETEGKTDQAKASLKQTG